MGHRDRRQAILRAAESLFLSRRFDRVRVDDVCKKSRVGKGTIYRYFKNKEDLYAQVILSGLDELHALLERKASGSGPADQKLLGMAQALRTFYRKRHSLFRSLHSVEFRRLLRARSLHAELREKQRGIVGVVASVIRSGVSDEQYRRDVPAVAAARIFLAGMRESSRPRGGTGSRPLALKRAVSLFLDGVRRR